MKAADLAFPVLVIDPRDCALAVFPTLEDLTWFELPHPFPHLMPDAVLIDAQNRMWSIRGVTCAGLAGSGFDRLRQAFSRRRTVDYELDSIGSISWDDLLERLCAESERQMAAIPEDERREDHAKVWSEYLAEIRACRDIQGLSKVLVVARTAWGNWFSSEGRSGRYEFLLVVATLWLSFCGLDWLWRRLAHGSETGLPAIVMTVTIPSAIYLAKAAAARRRPPPP